MVSRASAPAPEPETRPQAGPLETLLEALAEGVLVLDRDATVISANRAAERILGRPRRRLLGHDRREARIRFFREDGRPWRDLDQAVDTLAAQGGLLLDRVACRVLRPDRSFADVELSTRRVDWSRSGAQELLLTLDDVSGRRRAELAGRAAGERLRALADAASEGLLGLDAQGLVVELSAAAEAMFGRPRDELLGRPFEELLADADRDPLGLLRGRLLASPRRGPARANLRATGLRGSGATFPLELELSTFREGGRRLLAVAARDLADAREDAREDAPAGRALARFAHDLRTPLNAIIGFGQLLERAETGSLNDRQRRYVDRVVEAGRGLAALVEEVLDQAVLEAGELELRPETFDLAETCRIAGDQAAGAAARRSVELALEVPAGYASTPTESAPVR